MSENVQFDSDQQGKASSSRVSGSFTSRSVLGQSQVPGMAKWLMKHGIKSESAAKYMLLSVIVVAFTLMFIIYYFFVYYSPTVIRNNSISPLKQELARSHVEDNVNNP